MKSQNNMALAVRTVEGKIEVKRTKLDPWVQKHKLLALPIVRGAVSLIDTFILSMKNMTDAIELSGEEYEDETKFEKWLSKKTGKSSLELAMPIALVLAIALCIVLYVIIPSLLGQLFSKIVKSAVLVNIIEGVIRMAILVAYMFAISFMKDIKRMLCYHGAEHKTIACYEAGLDLTPENAKGMTRLHPRCGTSFLFLVMLISIFIFILFGAFEHYWVKVLTRLLMIPVVAGISYELLKILAKDNGKFSEIIKKPGLAMQKLTTQEPDEEMLEVAIAAFNAVLEMDKEDSAKQDQAEEIMREYDDAVDETVSSSEE